MFIDSITVVLFLAAVTVELSRVLKFDPVPMILAEIFCANRGGAATMCGDPQMCIRDSYSILYPTPALPLPWKGRALFLSAAQKPLAPPVTLTARPRPPEICRGPCVLGAFSL